jgi:hypothetical protein
MDSVAYNEFEIELCVCRSPHTSNVAGRFQENVLSFFN